MHKLWTKFLCLIGSHDWEITETTEFHHAFKKYHPLAHTKHKCKRCPEARDWRMIIPYVGDPPNIMLRCESPEQKEIKRLKERLDTALERMAHVQQYVFRTPNLIQPNQPLPWIFVQKIAITDDQWVIKRQQSYLNHDLKWSHSPVNGLNSRKFRETHSFTQDQAFKAVESLQGVQHG